MDQDREVNLILTECFFALGQGLARQPVTPEALAFWHNRYHERFSAALNSAHSRA